VAVDACMFAVHVAGMFAFDVAGTGVLEAKVAADVAEGRLALNCLAVDRARERGLVRAQSALAGPLELGLR
jgi:hypothetical protein